MAKNEREYSGGEELAHSITHGVGTGLAVAALVILVMFSALRKSAWEVVSCAVYGTTLIMLYLASTLYHAVKEPRAKRVLKIIDHAAIYLLIAGTYTPYTLSPLRGPLGWTMFGIIWTCALIGVLFKAFFTGRFKAFSLGSYLIMGCIVMTAMKPLLDALTTTGFVFLAVGGACYLLGALFYAKKSWKWSHAVWHLFVLAASTCHFFSILYGVAL